MIIDALIVDDEQTRHDELSKRYFQNVDNAYTFDRAIQYLNLVKYKCLQLDHDLADFSGDNGKELTGYDIVLYLVKFIDKEFWPDQVIVHSHNPVGAENIVKLCRNYGLPARWEPFRKND